MKKPTLIQWHWIAVIVLLLGIMWLASGCNPVKRLSRIGTKHPAALARVCIATFPTRDSVTGTITYLPGRTDTVAGITIDCDSAIRSAGYTIANSQGVSIKNDPKSGNFLQGTKIPCPPSTHTRDTIKVDSSRFRLGGPELYLSNHTRDSLSKVVVKKDAKISSLSKSRNWWMWIAIGLFAYTVARVILRIYTRISLP